MYHICPFFYSFFARFLRIFYRFSDPDGKLVRGYSETAGLAPLLPQRSLTEPQPEPEPEPDPRPLVGTVVWMALQEKAAVPRAEAVGRSA